MVEQKGALMAELMDSRRAALMDTWMVESMADLSAGDLVGKMVAAWAALSVVSLEHLMGDCEALRLVAQ